MKTIPMLDPDDVVRLVPLDLVSEAITHGGRMVTKVRSPKGELYWIPLDMLHDALVGGGVLESEPHITKRHSLVIDPHHFTPQLHGVTGRLEDKFKSALRKVQNVVLVALRRTEKLCKADATEQGGSLDAGHVEEILNAVNEVWYLIWSEVPDAITNDLEDAALAGASMAIGEANLHISDVNMINKLNQQALDWANDRAAELVGMRRKADGMIVPNPNAEWSISETTRKEINSIISKAFEDETPLGEIEDAIKQAGAFSDSRAKVIARTEVASAQVQSGLAIWRMLDLVKQANWQVSNLDPCDVCREIADAGPYDIENIPVPIVDSHPNCACVIVATQYV